MLGHRVIGKAAFAAQQAVVQSGRAALGDRVLGRPAPPAAEASSPPAPADRAPSLEALRLAVAENPALLRSLLRKEIQRPGGARAPALEMLREVALERGETALALAITQELTPASPEPEETVVLPVEVPGEPPDEAPVP